MPSFFTKTLLLILLCTYLHFTGKVKGLEGGPDSAIFPSSEEGKDRNVGKVMRKLMMMEKMDAFLMDYSPPGSNNKHGPGHGP